eukprot:gene9516-biopygen12228
MAIKNFSAKTPVIFVAQVCLDFVLHFGTACSAYCDVGECDELWALTLESRASEVVPCSYGGDCGAGYRPFVGLGGAGMSCDPCWERGSRCWLQRRIREAVVFGGSTGATKGRGWGEVQRGNEQCTTLVGGGFQSFRYKHGLQECYAQGGGHPSRVEDNPPRPKKTWMADLLEVVKNLKCARGTYRFAREWSARGVPVSCVGMAWLPWTVARDHRPSKLRAIGSCPTPCWDKRRCPRRVRARAARLCCFVSCGPRPVSTGVRFPWGMRAAEACCVCGGGFAGARPGAAPVDNTLLFL